MRSPKKFLYVGNFFDKYAYAILKPNIFGVSKIVKIDMNYKVVEKTNLFTFNHWFDGHLIAHHEPYRKKWITYCLDSNLHHVEGIKSESGFASYRGHLHALLWFNSYTISSLLTHKPELLQNMQPLKDGKTYFVSTHFCRPFLYRPELANKVVFIKKEDLSNLSHLF